MLAKLNFDHDDDDKLTRGQRTSCCYLFKLFCSTELKFQAVDVYRRLLQERRIKRRLGAKLNVAGFISVIFTASSGIMGCWYHGNKLVWEKYTTFNHYTDSVCVAAVVPLGDKLKLKRSQ